MSGPFGPRGGISSGIRPGNSSGRGGEPGSRTGGVISGCGLPGGIPGGGSLGVPGVDGGISGGSIGIGIIGISCPENDNDNAAPMFRLATSYSGAWQTASMLWPSAREECIAPRLAHDRKAARDHVGNTILLPFAL